MRRAHKMTAIGIKKLTFLPVELDQFVGTAVQIGNRKPGMAHDERRGDVAVVFD